METLPQIVDRLHQRRITLFAAGQEVRYRAPAGALSTQDKDYLRAHKADLLLYLQAEIAAREIYSAKPEFRSLASLTQEDWWKWLKPSPNQRCNNRLVITRKYAGATVAGIRSKVFTMMDRHDALRTSFREEGGALVAHLNSLDSFTIELDDVPETGSDHGIDQAISSLADEFSRDLPVDAPWLAKAKIAILPGSGVALILVFHHIVLDGNALALLVKELDAAPGDPGEDSGPPSTFREYCKTERNWFQASGAVLVDYWTGWLKRQIPLADPKTGAKLEWRPGTMVDWKFRIPGAYHAKLENLATNLRGSAFLVYTTLYAMALSKWAGQSRFPLRCLGTARNVLKSSATIGNFITADAIEVCVPLGGDFLSVFKIIRNEYLSSLTRRLPGLLTIPAHPDRPGCENIPFTQTIAATINYFSAEADRSIAPGGGTPDVWPPRIEKGRLIKWEIPLWPIYLRLQATAFGTNGVFEFNDDIIGAGSQEDLWKCFFSELEKVLSST